jgi:hypothetical protein
VITSLPREIIREMVATHLKEQTDLEPIILASLFFDFNNNRLNATDMNPLLIAVEFGLQGKTIEIESYANCRNQHISSELACQLGQQIRQLMQSMGVPNERIAMAVDNEVTSMVDRLKNDQSVARVNFKIF